MWETATQRLRATVVDDEQTCGMGFTAANELAVVHPDGIVVRNTDTNEVTARADFAPPPDPGPGPGTSFTVAPDGRSAIVGTWVSGSPRMTVWDLDPLKPLGDFGGNQSGACVLQAGRPAGPRRV